MKNLFKKILSVGMVVSTLLFNTPFFTFQALPSKNKVRYTGVSNCNRAKKEVKPKESWFNKVITKIDGQEITMGTILKVGISVVSIVGIILLPTKDRKNFEEETYYYGQDFWKDYKSLKEKQFKAKYKQFQRAVNFGKAERVLGNQQGNGCFFKAQNGQLKYYGINISSSKLKNTYNEVTGEELSNYGYKDINFSKHHKQINKVLFEKTKKNFSNVTYYGETKDDISRYYDFLSEEMKKFGGNFIINPTYDHAVLVT
ncbi:hypothetical protein FACS189465_0210 [Clostridia bacterium]|nr:hypothetical protein FACS189465_0210 [Clostridia bacterium]